MAEAGWFADPTSPGRQRYWDGAAWTSYVSDGGPTANDPVPVPPPPPPDAGPPPPPPPAAATPAGVADGPGAGRLYPPTLLGRIGFGVAAAGGVLTAATAGSTAVEQGVFPFRYIEVSGGSWIGVVAAVIGVGAAAAPWPWARLAGVGLTSLFAILVAFALIGFRTSDDLLEGVDVSLGPAGWLMLCSSLLLFAGTVVALVGLRRQPAGPDPALHPAPGKAVASLVLGIVGFFLPVTSAPAIGLGLFAMDDDRTTAGQIGGRGMAIAGLVLGMVSLSLWALFLVLLMLFAQP